ncbi:hypothetical protein J3Q64DRAFT_1247658 [Phycomyces blakesleeanus]|uniref:Uncharacterized protein n=1 Tax=Phycomyces blakesleeanus TaxID=4837 RepID=A0ABR3ARR2_PHYBL
MKVPVNVNKILIADIDGDSLNELILARTDRILHSFQLVDPEKPYPPFDPSMSHRNVTPSAQGSASTSAGSSNNNNNHGTINVSLSQPQPQQQQSSHTVSSTFQSSLSVLSGSKEKNKPRPKPKPLDAKDSKQSVLIKGMGWSKAGRPVLKEEEEEAQDNNTNKGNPKDPELAKQPLKSSTFKTDQERGILKDKDMWIFDGQVSQKKKYIILLK